MKKLFLSLLLVAAASAAQAQTSYSVAFTSTTQQDTDLIEIIQNDNNRTCLNLNLAVGCTQAQACVAPGITCAGGASCTAAQARACNARIFSSATTPLREEFMLFHYLQPGFVNDVGNLPPAYQDTLCRNWQTFNTTQRNTLCTAAGLATGCRLCKITP